MTLLKRIKEINSKPRHSPLIDPPLLLLRRNSDVIIPAKRIRQAATRVFNPNFLAHITFIDCNTRRTYCQIDKHLEYHVREEIEQLMEQKDESDEWKL